MRIANKIIWLLWLIPAVTRAGAPDFQDSLLDRLTGQWILTGDIMGQVTTHDIEARWVLNHMYFQVHEVSREKNTDGSLAYEAIIYIGWDSHTGQYTCLWLDVTSGEGLNGQVIGRGKRTGDEIPFDFKGSDGSLFHNTFRYNRTDDSWQWIMNGEENGKLQPFARLTLNKKT